MTLVQFINHMRHLVEQQQNEAKMAIYGRGVYEMKEEYRAYAFDEGTWYRKSEPQRDHCIEKFNTAPVISRSLPWDSHSVTSAYESKYAGNFF